VTVGVILKVWACVLVLYPQKYDTAVTNRQCVRYTSHQQQQHNNVDAGELQQIDRQTDVTACQPTTMDIAATLARRMCRRLVPAANEDIVDTILI